jgi:hypothetical protein
MTTTLDEPPRPSAPAPSGQRRLFLGILAAVVILAVLAAIVIAIAIGRASAARHTATAPRGDITAAGLDVVSGVSAVTVHTADLGRDLYRISTPGSAEQVPSVSSASTPDGPLGTVALTGGGSGQLDIILSSAVTWRLRISGGANEARLDLRGAPLAEVDLASGISTIELWLPSPRGTATLTETGGTSSLTMHAPTQVPVKITVDGGAGTATVDGTTHTGVPAGTTYAPNGWDRVTDRYDVRLVGGVSHVDLDRFAG